MKQTPAYEAHTPSKFATGTALFTILVAIFLIVFGTLNFIQNRNTESKLNEQVARTEKLANEIKVIAQQNKESSQRAANYAYCNAYLFAKYTQDGWPIVIEDLNKCVVAVFPNGEGAPTIPTEGFQSTQGSTNPTSAPNATTQRSTTAQGTSSPQANQPTSPTTGSTPQQTQSVVTLQPSNVSPLLTIVPDVKIPGILEIR